MSTISARAFILGSRPVSGVSPSEHAADIAALNDDLATEVTRAEAAEAAVGTALAAEVNRATSAEALLAPLTSPALTGTPTAPTAEVGTSSAQIATTAYVNAAIDGGIDGLASQADLDARVSLIGGPLWLDGLALIGAVRDAAKRVTVGWTADGQTVIYRAAIEKLAVGTSLLIGASALVTQAAQYVGNLTILHGWRDSASRLALGILSDGSVYAHHARITALEVESHNIRGLTPLLDQVVLIGDSLTQPDANTFAWAAATGWDVVNLGIGGQTSVQCSARIGGRVIGVTIDGDQIVSGANTITAMDGAAIDMTEDALDTQILSTASDGKTRTLRGRLGSVLGTMQRSTESGVGTAEIYIFTPDEGETVPVYCPPNSPFVIEDALADSYHRSMVIIAIGRNDNPWEDPDGIIANIAAIVERLRERGNDRFVIIPPPNGYREVERLSVIPHDGYDNILTLEHAIIARWPQNTFSARRWLIDCGLESLSITPTTQDEIDIADDTVPASLRRDGIHWINEAYAPIVAAIMAQIITPKGWLQ